MYAEKPQKHAQTPAEAFAKAVESLADFGEWKVFEYASGPMRATLHGKRGRVEVWGAEHQNEVWLIEKATKREVFVCANWTLGGEGTDHCPMRKDGRAMHNGMELSDAVAEACAMAGMQMTLRTAG